MTRVACEQLAPRIGDPGANRKLAVRAVRAGVRDRADLIVLPELVTSGYCFASRDEAAAVAITREDPMFEEWADEASHGPAVVVGGFCELAPDGLLYNSAAVVDESGVLAVYRKSHLWDREKLFFQPGREAPEVLDTVAGRIGVLICYDLEFPEMTRALALQGAELIVVPANWPLVERPDGEHPPEVVIAMAAARTNRVFIACCDRTGVERGQEWTGGSTVVSETGWVIAEAGDGGRAVADIDLARTRDKRLSDFNDVLTDRRPELYEGVLNGLAATADRRPLMAGTGTARRAEESNV